MPMIQLEKKITKHNNQPLKIIFRRTMKICSAVSETDFTLLSLVFRLISRKSALT